MDWLDVVAALGRRALGGALRWLWTPVAAVLIRVLATHYLDDYTEWQGRRAQQTFEQFAESLLPDTLPPGSTPVAPGKLRLLETELDHP